MDRLPSKAIGPRPIASSVRMLRRQFDMPDVDPLVTVAAQWGSIVGEPSAACSTPLSVRDRTLTVEVTDTAVAEHLRWSSAAVVDAVNDLCGAVVIVGLRVRFARPA